MATPLVGRIEVRPLSIEGAFLFVFPDQQDQRGSRRSWFDEQAVHTATGRPLGPVLANVTVSHQGALRGIKYSRDGRAGKYVSCLSGVVLDVVVDLRVGSPAFGASHIRRLDGGQPVGLFLAPGLGHATLALTEQAAMAYLHPAHDEGPEVAVHPFDSDLSIAWPSGLSFLLSDGDTAAPTLGQARDAGLLPAYLGGEP